MTASPVHGQPNAVPHEQVRALTSRAADLCRRAPAVYAAAVRHADRLRDAGVDHHEALRQALDQATG